MPLHGTLPQPATDGAAGRNGRSRPPARSTAPEPSGLLPARRGGVTLPRQDVEHDVAAAQLGRQRLGAGRLDRIEPGLGNRRQDVDELAIAVVMAGKPPADLRQGWRQVPVAERVAVPAARRAC